MSPDHPSLPPAPPPPSAALRFARRLALGYGAAATLWVLGSSAIAATLVPDGPALARIELGKGLAFVLASSLLLFALARRWSLRLAEGQQAESDRRAWLDLAVNGSGGAGWSIEQDPDGAVRVRLSSQLRAFLGCTEAELPDSLQAWQARMPPEDCARAQALLRACLAGERLEFDFSYRIRHKSGSMRWLHSRGRLVRSGRDGMRWVGMDWDVTADRRRSEELQLAAKVFESSTEGVLVMDDQERIVAVNEAYTRITGYTLGEVGGRTPAQFLSSARNVDLAGTIRRTVHDKGAWRGEYSGHRRDGSAYTARLIISAVQGEHGAPSHYVGILSDVTELKDSRAQLDLMRHRDALTGLPNEALFLQHLSSALPRATPQQPLTLALVDLARFQTINDSLGRRAGDNVLLELAQRLVQFAGPHAVGRIGGDSFALLNDRLEDPAAAMLWGEALQGEIARSFSVLGTQLHLSACIGLALHPLHAGSGEELMRRAASALSEARRKGAGSVLCYRAEMSERSLERVRMETALRNALRRGEFRCAFQPRVRLADDRWIGAEALIRWPGSDGVMVQPERFLAVAEDAGLLPQIDRWMLRAAVGQVAAWRGQGRLPPDFRVSVNVSASQVGPGLVERVEQALAETGLPASALELELTERLIMSAPERAAQVLRQLRELGVRVAVDDFGTGYSSLSYLHRLPIDSLKVDRSFVSELPDRAEALAIVRSIVALGRSLKLQLVAEGVETTAQAQAMRELGCDEAQGFLYAPGLAAERFESELQRHAGEWLVRF